ncbi:AAA family ATPase, partial [Escherichia coli]|nr:AAA family ATPase [Escherichia coli]
MIKLSDEQIKAKDTILEFLLDSNQHFFVLQGTAGTGKTTLIKEVSKEWTAQQQLLKTLDPKY